MAKDSTISKVCAASNKKFDPVWTPEDLACPRGLAVPQVLYEVSTLILNGVKGLVRQ